jgi:uncharacterized Zn finger protein
MSTTCPDCDGYVLTVVKQTDYVTIYRCEDCGAIIKVRHSGEVEDDD